jgi:hypothetical protein
MNVTNDDRLFGEWLSDVPRRAPDGPIEAAVDHARAHPRRRDPLAFLRRDPMAAPRTGPMSALGLLLAAMVVAVIGSRPSDPVVPPIVSPSPTPSASATPSPSSSAAARFDVALIDELGKDVRVEVVDESGTLVGARSGQPDGGPEIGPSRIGIVNDPTDPNVLIVGWVDGPCDVRHRLTIDASGRVMLLEQPACQGDAMGIGRTLVLTFVEAIPAAEVEASRATVESLP